MQRKALLSLAIALTLGCASTAFAQDSDLSGVTMRVLDNVKDIDAVVIAIGDDDRDAAANDGERADGARRDGDRGTSGGDREGDDRAADERRGEDREADRRERDRDDVDHDDREERGEGQLEDNDVTRDPAREGTDDTATPVEP